MTLRVTIEFVESANSSFRVLPSVDELLRTKTAAEIVSAAGERHAAELARTVVAKLRSEIADGRRIDATREELFQAAEELLRATWIHESRRASRRVINATGVVIHTNLGRAPLSDAARDAMLAAAGYCNLEYDLDTAARGRRGGYAEDLICELTGAEAAVIVNNCAAAAYFVLSALAAGGEVIVSRGELVEIGGDFRVPDVLERSGAVLREIGTTNRTKVADYEKAVGDATRMILRVHPSNYRIVGFTTMPELSELAELAHKHDLISFEDIGSGALVDVSDFGLTNEPLVRNSIEAGVDIVAFSGDKLLGGPQAGIVAGNAELIGKLRKHPLYRALRVDKIVYSTLEATLGAYRRGATHEIPVTRMLSMTKDEISARAERLIDTIGSKTEYRFELVDGNSAVGGGAAPDASLATTLIAVSHADLSAERIEYSLRNADVPVIARIVDGRVMLDLRTVSQNDEEDLVGVLAAEAC